MAIDPQTGLDTDDPEVKAMLAQQTQDRQAQTHAAGALPVSPNDLVASQIKNRLDGPPPGTSPSAALLDMPVSPAPPSPSPAGGQGAVAPLPLPQQKKEVTATDSSTTSVKKIVTPEERKLQGDIAKTEADQEAAIRKEGELAGQAADIHQAAAQKKVELSQQHGAKLQAVIDQGNAEIKKRQEAYDQAQKTYAEAKPQDFWANDPNGSRRFWAGIALALGGFNASHTGGRNVAFDNIQTAVEHHDAQERARIDKLEKVAIAKRGDIEMARQEKISRLTDLAAWKAQAYDEAADQVEAKLAALGKPEAEIKTNESVLAARAKAQQVRQQWFDATRSEVHSTVTKRTQEILSDPNAAGAGSGRGITDARQRAMIATGIDDQMKTAQAISGKGVKLSEADLQRIQDNRAYLKAGEHDPIKTTIARKLGVAPRSEFDGLSPEKQALAGSLNLIGQKAAMLAAGSQTQEAISHARDIVDLLTPGLGTQERQRRMQYIKNDLVGANVGLVPNEVRAAQAGAAAAGGAGAPYATPSKAEIKSRMDEARRWLQKNPQAPEAAGVRAQISKDMQLLGSL